MKTAVWAGSPWIAATLSGVRIMLFFSGAVELEQAQLRAAPVDAVVALDVTEKVRVDGPGLGRLAPVPIVPGMVIHAVELAVLEHARVATGVSFPGSVGREHDFLRHGRMELQPGPPERLSTRKSSTSSSRRSPITTAEPE